MRKHRPRLPPSALKPPPHSVMKPPQVGVPKAPPRGGIPHPRRPRHVRDSSGSVLGDLFRLFPDIPWAPRPVRRVSLRTLARRLRG